LAMYPAAKIPAARIMPIENLAGVFIFPHGFNRALIKRGGIAPSPEEIN